MSTSVGYIRLSRQQADTWLGQRYVTSCFERYNGNAYGTVIFRERIRAGFELFRELPVMCGHGGSMWLCESCATAIIAEKESGNALQCHLLGHQQAQERTYGEIEATDH